MWRAFVASHNGVPRAFAWSRLHIVRNDHSSLHATLSEAITSLQTFSGSNLTQTLAQIENSLQSVTIEGYSVVAAACGAKADVLRAAGLVKNMAGQINVLVHALGILLCLPHILRPSEAIEYVSLGAGNTGRAFDLVTDKRIAEFKFIRWQGGAEAVRQNSVFKDFYELAENPTQKQKCLYVLGMKHVEKFFNGGRAISSVLSRHVKLRNEFADKFGDRYRTVRDYYELRKGLVVIQDVSPFVPELVAATDEAEDV
jgi:hypothetical protein